jgi:hypothetical protein
MGALGGCTSYRPPSLSVAGVAVTERTEAGVVLEFTLNATNVNSVALPLREMRYSLELDGREVFRGYRSPEATLRRYGQQHLKVPAAIALEPGQAPPSGAVKYTLEGTLTYLVPGEFAQVLFDADVRRPKVRFSQKGTLDMGDAIDPSGPAAPAAPPATP